MRGIQKTVFIDARFVCDRGKIDAHRIAKYFTANGYRIVTRPKNADVIVFNCCGFSTAIVETGLKQLQRYKGYDAEILLVGGLPGTDKDAYLKMFSGKALIHKDLEKLDQFYPNHTVPIAKIEDQYAPWVTRSSASPWSLLMDLSLIQKASFSIADFIFRHRIGEDYLILGNPRDLPTSDVFRLRISWGCTFNCSYCAIIKATGKLRSKPLQECVHAFTTGLQGGFRTFHIIGVDPAGYGQDCELTYPQLIHQLCTQDGNYRFRLEAVHPAWLVTYQYDLETVCRQGKIAAISVPFQSGSTRILHLMNRYADLEKLLEALHRIKAAWPSLAIATNVIAGFPTETDAEFLDTLRFIDQASIDLGVIFPISLKPGTKASTIEPRIPPETIQQRMTTAKKYLRKRNFGVVNIHGQGLWFGRPVHHRQDSSVS
jgi:tRNA A37 methylthiotransferase MiaB